MLLDHRLAASTSPGARMKLSMRKVLSTLGEVSDNAKAKNEENI